MIMESAAFLAKNKKPTEARDQEGARQQSLPLRHPCPHRARRQARRRPAEGRRTMNHSDLPPRPLHGCGALVVSFSLGRPVGGKRWRKPSAKPVALTEVDSFLAIDNERRRHRLFRQGRSRHRRRAPRCARSSRTSSTCQSTASSWSRATPCSRPTRARPGAASPSRSAACSCVKPRPPRARRWCGSGQEARHRQTSPSSTA